MTGWAASAKLGHAGRRGAAEPHEVRVCTRPGPDGWVHVEITDTGAGIPAELADSIFEPFFTTKAEGHGTGLGLAICQSIVTDLAGRIEVESRVGAGSTFRVILRSAMGDRAARA